MRYIYILRCADDTFYTGITTDLNRRLDEHNHSLIGAKYTRMRRPVSLVRSQPATDRSEASKIEYIIKKTTRMKKQNIIRENKVIHI